MNRDDHLDQRDCAITLAHESISEAIRHLDGATVHADAIGDEVHRSVLAGIIRQLSAAREPLAEHIDWLEKTKRERRKACPIECDCLCHLTCNGPGLPEEHPGRPCPGKDIHAEADR